MSIELHCTHCSKLIRAPESAGGQHGKCPYCQQSVYIPLPASDDDVIPLAPIDEAAERRESELLAESIQFASAIDRDPTMQNEPGEPRGPARGAVRDRGESAGGFVDIPAEVERYVVAMKNSKLEDAERIAAKLKRTGQRARDYVEGLFLDQMPAQIADVPTPLLKGFLKALMGRLEQS